MSHRRTCHDRSKLSAQKRTCPTSYSNRSSRFRMSTSCPSGKVQGHVFDSLKTRGPSTTATHCRDYAAHRWLELFQLGGARHTLPRRWPPGRKASTDVFTPPQHYHTIHHRWCSAELLPVDPTCVGHCRGQARPRHTQEHPRAHDPSSLSRESPFWRGGGKKASSCSRLVTDRC